MIAGRYRMLDAWRAVGALAVVIFHCTNTVLTPGMGWWARLCLSGWVGVFVFFPVSGYCICAALSRRENAAIGPFLRRRWRRTVTPYWASIAVCVAVAWLAAPFNQGRVEYLNLGVGKWAAMLTLTQVFAGIPQAINPVYWSLCYEEQFYLVMAIALLLPVGRRAALFVGITAAAGVYQTGLWPGSLRVPGIFLEYWLAFSCGVASYIWLRWRSRRWWAAAIFATVAAAVVASHELTLSISLAASLAFIVSAPLDDAFASSRVGGAMIGVGAMSYSLYLVHVPIGGRVVNLLRHQGWPLLVPPMLAVVVSLACAWAFYVLVERRFMNVPRAAATATRGPVPAPLTQSA